MKASKVIIEYEGVGDLLAMDAVRHVMRAGRISECSTGKHYCWLTVFHYQGADLEVVCRRRAKDQTSDSFLVRRKVKRAKNSKAHL